MHLTCQNSVNRRVSSQARLSTFMKYSRIRQVLRQQETPTRRNTCEKLTQDSHNEDILAASPQWAEDLEPWRPRNPLKPGVKKAFSCGVSWTFTTPKEPPKVSRGTCSSAGCSLSCHLCYYDLSVALLHDLLVSLLTAGLNCSCPGKLFQIWTT